MMNSLLIVFMSTFQKNHAFSYNVASGSMGSIDFVNGKAAYFIKSYFIENWKYLGGAISITNRINLNITNMIFFSNCTFINNSATNGASVYIMNLYKIEVIVHQCNFFLNWGRTGKNKILSIL